MGVSIIAMIVGVLSLQISVFDAMSLKDKRSALKSLKDRISHRYNVSIAEVNHQDSMRTALLGVAMVGNDSRFIASTLSKIVDFVRKAPQVSLVDYSIETI